MSDPENVSDPQERPPEGYYPTPPGYYYPYPYPPGYLPQNADLPPQPRKPHPNFWWAILWCIALLLVAQVFTGVVAGFVAMALLFVAAPDLIRVAPDASLDQVMSTRGMSIIIAAVMFATQVVTVLFSWAVIRLVVGRDWPRILGLRRPGTGHLILVLLSFPAMVVLGNVVYGGLKEILPGLGDEEGTSMMEEMVKLFNTWPWAFAVLVIGVGPGIGEELWCRGFLGQGLVGRHGVVLGVLLSSFFFGIIHIIPAQAVMAMIVGVWLHFVYLTTRSLWVPILLHFLNNSLAVVANRSEFLTKMEGRAQDNQVLVLLAALALLASAAWALYQSRVRLEPAQDEKTDWTPEYEGASHPPQQSTRAVVRPFPGWLALSLCAGCSAALLAVLLHAG